MSGIAALLSLLAPGSVGALGSFGFFGLSDRVPMPRAARRPSSSTIGEAAASGEPIAGGFGRVGAGSPKTVTGAASDQAWSWDSEASLLRYRAERQATQRAIKRAHDALAAALISRLVSMIHASAGAVRRDAAPSSWKLEVRPDVGDPAAFHFGLRADF